jgi:hypothetical protein
VPAEAMKSKHWYRLGRAWRGFAIALGMRSSAGTQAGGRRRSYFHSTLTIS